MFDKAPKPASDDSHETEEARIGPEDERIALRCNRKELQLLDSFVANGEFRSRSELMRQALREYLRARALSGITTPRSPDAQGLVEVPVRLRADEVTTLNEYATLVGNGRTLGDVLADTVRRGELELKVGELVQRHRGQIRDAAEARAQLGALERSGRDLQRKGVVGR
ncbi:MAG: ribbon-helix-helix domain-containing protein [Thermoplasmata archaeon]